VGGARRGDSGIGSMRALVEKGISMFPAAAASSAVWGGGHFVFFPFFLLIPIFWIVVIGLVIFFVSRRRRAWWRHNAQYGPWTASRSAESTLAERFAQGDIDEVEYRARLEVLRANSLPHQP
jgi:putative membrane protein